MTVRQLILTLLEDPLISIDQEVAVENLSNDTQEYYLKVGDNIDPDPDGYRILFIEEKA